MPNWCNNSITISGSTESLKDLWESAQESKGLLSAIRPMPKELEDTTSPAPQDGSQPMVDGFDNWYDWCNANWGTKWDVDLEGLEFTDNGDGTATIAGWFDSAWAPPIEAYEQFADDFDSCYLEAFYHESGMCFVGCWDSEGGNDYFEYGDIEGTDAIEEAMPAYLNEAFGITEDMRMWEEEEEMA